MVIYNYRYALQLYSVLVLIGQTSAGNNPGKMQLMSPDTSSAQDEREQKVRISHSDTSAEGIGEKPLNPPPPPRLSLPIEMAQQGDNAQSPHVESPVSLKNDALSARRGGSQVVHASQPFASPQRTGSCVVRSPQALASPQRMGHEETAARLINGRKNTGPVSVRLDVQSSHQFIAFLINKFMPNSLIGMRGAHDTGLSKGLYNYCAMISASPEHLLFNYLAGIEASLLVINNICRTFDGHKGEGQLLSDKECYKLWGNMLASILGKVDEILLEETPHAGRLLLDAQRIRLMSIVQELRTSAKYFFSDVLGYMSNNLVLVFELAFGIACANKSHAAVLTEDFADVDLAASCHSADLDAYMAARSKKIASPRSSPGVSPAASPRSSPFSSAPNSPRGSLIISPRPAHCLIDLDGHEHDAPLNSNYVLLSQDVEVSKILNDLNFCAKFLLFSTLLEEEYKQLDASKIRPMVKI